MRNKLIYLLLAVCALAACQNREEEKSDDGIVRLPLTFVEGFGPFNASMGTLGKEKSTDTGFWSKTYLPVTGMPKTWKLIKKSMVWLDVHQLIYQNYQAGKLREEEFAQFKKSSDWEPNPAELPDKPIKCFVYVIRGRDEKGKAAVMVDTNNDLDFSDETPFYPTTAYKEDYSSIGKYEEQEKKYFTYEAFEEGRVVTKRIPIVIKRMPAEPAGNDFWYYFPLHARTTLKVNGETHEIALPGGASVPSFESSSLAVLGKDSTHIYEFPEQIQKGDLITVGGLLNKMEYRNKGVSLYHNALELEGSDVDEQEYSLQAGHPFKPFVAKEFQTGQTIALSDYQDKYVFIDFWGTWCQGCVLELPELQRVYEGVDKQKVEFVSIAGIQSPQLLEKFLKKHPLAWPQIISDDKNKLIETYKISRFPTNVLVGPDGRVIARNLHGEVLERKLVELTKR